MKGPECGRIGCDTPVDMWGHWCKECQSELSAVGLGEDPVMRKPADLPPKQMPGKKPAQFAMSNDELRRAILDTSEAITKLYNGPQKTALQSHLESLLVVERDRARKISLDENT